MSGRTYTTFGEVIGPPLTLPTLLDTLLRFKTQRVKGNLGQKLTPNFRLFIAVKIRGESGEMSENFFSFTLTPSCDTLLVIDTLPPFGKVLL